MNKLTKQELTNLAHYIRTAHYMADGTGPEYRFGFESALDFAASEIESFLLDYETRDDETSIDLEVVQGALAGGGC